MNSEISIIGHTEFKDKYKNNSKYKFLNDFIKKSEKMEDLFDEINPNISLNKNISNEENKKEDFTEGLITKSSYYHGNNNSNNKRSLI